MSADDRAEILDEAKGYVTKDRNSSYGEPEDNFGAIAAIWNAQGVRVNGKLCDPVDVALLMAGMKLARLKSNPGHRDSWADTIGYMACGWDVAKQEINAEAELADLPVVNSPVSAARGYWVSEKRCLMGQEANVRAYPHVSHSFGLGNILWCDGYVVGAPEKREPFISPELMRNSKLLADIGVVKRCSMPGHQGCAWKGGEFIHHPSNVETLADALRTQRDVEVVKRVADKQRACEGKEPHHNCEPGE